MHTTSMRRTFMPVVAAMLAFAIASVAEAQQGSRDGDRGTTVNLRGQVTAFSGSMLTVTTADGDTLSMTVPKSARISSLTRIDFSELKQGDFIASAGMRQNDGTLKAIDVRVFPASGPRPPEVHRRFHLGPESTMTNATVDAFIGGISGRTFKVKYKGGEQTIVVPEDAPVMRQERGTAALLKPGVHVSLVGRKDGDGNVSVVRMAVGMNGLVPPT